MKKKVKQLLAVMMLMALTLALAGCGESTTDAISEAVGEAVSEAVNDALTGTDDESEEMDESAVADEDEWQTVFEFNGNLSDENKSATSDIFELAGGEIKVTYSVVTTSDGGNIMLYILPEGATIVTDANGDFKMASTDIMSFSATEKEKILEKDAGSYYIEINSASVESYEIKIEEKL